MAAAAAEGRSSSNLDRRSASFKRLESWSGPGQGQGQEGGGGGGGPAGGAPPGQQQQQQQQRASGGPEPIVGRRRSPCRAASFSVSRTVARISAAAAGAASSSPGRRSLSPAVRHLSQRFGAQDREAAAAAATCRCGGAQPASAGPAAAAPHQPSGGSSRGAGPEAAALDWPSVTEMRKLFGETFRRQQQRQAEGGPAGLPVPPPRGLSLPAGAKSPPADRGAPLGPQEGEEAARPCRETPSAPPPPPPPPRSCVPFPGQRHQQQQQQAWASLHSWHRCGKAAQAAPSSPSAFLSGFAGGQVGGSEEEELACPGRAPSTHAPYAAGNGRHKAPESEEVNPRGSLQKLTVQKEEEEDVGAMDQDQESGGKLAGMEWYLKAQEALTQGFPVPADERTRSCAETKMLTTEAKPVDGIDAHRLYARVPSEGSSSLPATHAASPSAPALPLVSRVSKVTIPPFVPSPCGSRSSSRYSSTETLKEEAQSGAAWPGQGRSLFRSPSFGQCESLARLQPQVRIRPKLPLGIAKMKQELPSVENLRHCASEAVEKSKHRKSMSNPDIATETLTLLSFLKSDLSELKARKKGNRPSDQEEVGPHDDRSESFPQDTTSRHLLSRTQSEAHQLNRWPVGSRPTLKDLTATLRRAKSFTCSDKITPRRLLLPNTMKQSSSELLLASTRDHDGSASDSEIGQSEGEDEDGLLVVIQDQYIQEARQVFENISKMGAQQDYNFVLDQKDSKSMKRGADKKVVGPQKMGVPENIPAPNVEKDGTEGNLLCGKSLAKLSAGPDSSMVDEGIVTEPELVPAYRYLQPSVAAWQSANPRGSDVSPSEAKAMLPPCHDATKTKTETAAEAADVLLISKATPQGLLEVPAIPGALRRRRKFPSVGNSGSESGSGSNGDSSGDTYRSLSDPMPHRRRSIPEHSKSCSVDSNLLGSLNGKSGFQESSTVVLSEYAGSAASDLSVCSDGVKDYRTLIQNIVSQPGAMDKVIDEKGNGKTIKKKSFSDPSRRGELGSFDGPGEPITEMDQSIPPSSSEPILSEPRDQLKSREQDGRKLYAQSEQVLPVPLEGDMVDDDLNYGFDPKLAEVLSPRIARRSSKKRSNRVNCQEALPPPMPPSGPATLGKARPASKHVRHTSEPATFIPISEANLSTSLTQSIHIACTGPTKPDPVLQILSLEEDVSKHCTLTLGSGESSAASPVDMSRCSPATPVPLEPKVPQCPQHHAEHRLSSPRSKAQVDMRKHVTMTLLDTEQSYVESLRTLMQGYMKPLKQPENSVLCDPSLVDEIFDQIPELLEHHEEFLEQISGCLQSWHAKQKVGDILVQSFSKAILVNIYSAYIDNFLNAKDAVRIAKEARPAFMKFLEQNMRENKEKQALSDLMIKPVQRIPRYELLVKDLLKHTPEEHPDHPFLIEALRSIKQVAERINKGMRSAEEVERSARIVQEIESHIEGMEDLQAPLRKFVRQEMVLEMKALGGKKDRSLFLFTDLLVCTTLKRKSGSLRRSSMSLYTAASVIDTASKYKLLWKLPLEDMDIVKGSSQSTNRESIQKAISRLDEDLSTLGQVSKLSETLSFPHQSLDDVLKDLMAAIHRELTEKQSLSFTLSFPPNKMELTAAKADGTESYIFEFPNPDARQSFEQAFEDTKKKLASHKNCLDPEFLKAIPIMKTRSGMQFSCASPSHSSPENAYEVWVCNSDGYVGQVCLLSIRKEPIVEACIAVCSARILCIATVPGLKRACRERPEPLASPSSEPAPAPLEESDPQQCLHISISGSSLELSEPMDSASRELVPFDSDDTDDESSPSPSGTLQSQASHSTISSSFGNEEIPGAKDVTAETTSSEEEQDPGGFLPIASTFAQHRNNSESPMDGRAIRRSSRGSFTRGSLEDLLTIDPEAYQSSMWLGTEDGCIHVYQSSDNIRNRKNSMKMQHAAAVTCILYLDNQVFVSLANGELVAYQREAGHFWDSQNSKSLSLGSPGSPVTKMVAVAEKLWCGCQNRVIVLNPSLLQQEHAFHIGQDSSRSVTCMVSSGLGTWVTLQGSAQVRLYHPVSYEQVAEVDVTPPVHKMLAGSDAIIRQHKAACLRITALLACKDLLWIGTSAGVVLTLSLAANANATFVKTLPLPAGLSQGHTGHVRFLTSIELPEGFDLFFPLPRDPGIEKSSDLEKRDSTRPRSSKSKMLVISGGDGYEDFRLTSSSETVGRDDSTNHLLLWRV